MTQRAKEILNQHAMLYKKYFGQCVGHVVRSTSQKTKHEFTDPWLLSKLFGDAMKYAKIVDENGKPRFTFHALRHWCASHWVRALEGDWQQAAQWLGHKNASMTMDTYGHCLDPAEAREKFQRMPDWLEPVLEIDAIGAPLVRPALP